MRLNEVTQGRLERYEDEFLTLGQDVKSVARFNRIVLEAGKTSGIAAELPDDLSNLQPWQVSEWTHLLLEHIAKAKQPPTVGES